MDTKDVVKKMTIMVIVILAFLAIFYGIAEIINKNTKKETNNTNEENYEPTIDYDTILVQNIFNQQRNSYYVYAKLDTDTNISKYNEKVTNYKNTENALKVYTIDLSSAFNKTYLKEESDFNSNPPIFKGSTILKIEEKQIKEIYELDDINNAFEV